MEANTISCPKCGARIDATGAEPLARVACPSCGEKVRVSRSFDHFELIETLGLGGMGTVYRARDRQLDRDVALKLLRPDLGPEYAAQLQQEARITAAINHPNVVQVFSFGKAHDQYYLVMELVDRGTLDDLIEEKKKIPEADALRAGIEVAKGLRAACEKGLIHRDVKPANILFAADGAAKVSDFGLAGIVEPVAQPGGAIWGTPYYVAPERLNNEPEDFRSDIFSLGATLFHAIAGRPPLEGETTSASELHALKAQPPKLNKIAPDVSPETSNVIGRMIAPDPRLRYASYDDAIAALEKARRRLLGEPERSGRVWWIAAAAVIALLAGGYLYHLKNEGKRSPEPVKKSAANYAAQFDEARGLLRDGNFPAARVAFAKLATDARDVQPTYSWARLHQAVAAALDGEETLARQAVHEVENAGTRGFADPSLGASLLEIGKLADRQSAVSLGDVPAGPARPFALFFFGMMDLQLGRFTEAAELLEAFASLSPPAALAWVNDYKPLAQKYLADCRSILKWREMIASAQTPAAIQKVLADLRDATPRLQPKTLIAAEVARDEKDLVQRLGQADSAQRSAIEQKQQELLARETPGWQEALAKFRGAVGSYDFVAAATAIRGAQVTEKSLRDQQAFFGQVASWLIEWKTDLVQDLRSHGYQGRLYDRARAEYAGINGVKGEELILRHPYGMVPKPWTAIVPASQYIAVSLSFARGQPDRVWRCGVFAWAIGSADAAKPLLDQAAPSKPVYQQARPFFDQLKP